MEIGLNKLLLFPGKLAALQAASAAGPDASYPVSVELSLTNTCNQQCVWCSDYELRNRLPGTLGTEVLYRLFDDLAAGGTRGITIEGGGEPTLHPEFAAVVRRARERGLAVGLITNGVELHYRELLGEFEWLRISLDAADADSYRRLKGLDAFARVLANIAAAAKAARVCGVGYILTRENLAGLEELLPRLRDLGVAYVHFRPVVDHPDLLAEFEPERLRRFATPTFSIIADGLTENKVRGNAALPCFAHSVTSIISASGDAFLCGRLNIHAWLKPLGNINRESFAGIWSGATRRTQAAQVAEAAFCANNCPECRLSKYNLLLANLRGLRTRSFI